MNIYGDMCQALTAEMGSVFKQGDVKYVSPPTTTGPDYDPVYTPGTEYDVQATVSGVSQKYVKDGYISASDLQLLVVPFDVEPDSAGKMSVDGELKQIIQVDQIPAAGEPVAWRVFCKS